MFNTRFKNEYSSDKEKQLMEHLVGAESLLKEMKSNMETSRTGVNMGDNDNLDDCIDTNNIIKEQPELCDPRKLVPSMMDNAINIALMFQKVKGKLEGMYDDATQCDIVNGHDAMDMKKIVYDDLKNLVACDTSYQSTFNKLNGSIKERAAKRRTSKQRRTEEAAMKKKLKELEEALNKPKNP
jgi:hypothetical protein